jgi:hypothetical protein
VYRSSSNNRQDPIGCPPPIIPSNSRNPQDVKYEPPTQGFVPRNDTNPALVVLVAIAVREEGKDDEDGSDTSDSSVARIESLVTSTIVDGLLIFLERCCRCLSCWDVDGGFVVLLLLVV